MTAKGVYGNSVALVNRCCSWPENRIAVGRNKSLWVSSSVALLVSACQVSPTITRTDYLVAARYGAQASRMDPESDEWDAMRGDLRSISDLGFQTIILQGIQPEERAALLDFTSKLGFRVLLPELKADHFVQTGFTPSPFDSLEELVQSYPPEVRQHPGFAGLFVEGPAHAATLERASLLKSAYQNNGISFHVFLSGEPVAGFGSVQDGQGHAVVRFCAPGYDSFSGIERLLADYHSALIDGNTQGLIIEGWPIFEQGENAENNQDGRLRAMKTSARAVLHRAHRWGPRIFHASARMVESVDDSTDYRAVLLIRPKSAFLLVVNSLAERRLRGNAEFAASDRGRRFARAVEVPAESDRHTGMVVEAKRGRFIIPLNLRPGDAVLFELF